MEFGVTVSYAGAGCELSLCLRGVSVLAVVVSCGYWRRLLASSKNSRNGDPCTIFRMKERERNFFDCFVKAFDGLAAQYVLATAADRSIRKGL